MIEGVYKMETKKYNYYAYYFKSEMNICVWGMK